MFIIRIEEDIKTLILRLKLKPLICKMNALFQENLNKNVSFILDGYVYIVSWTKLFNFQEDLN